MSMIPEETVDQVRESADLVGLISEAVELKRTGSDYRGPCPFHGGTHRNFAVIPKKNRYYCFVCHASGDVFSWLMKRFGMDYPTAVREAARRAGIDSMFAGGSPNYSIFDSAGHLYSGDTSDEEVVERIKQEKNPEIIQNWFKVIAVAGDIETVRAQILK